MAKSLTCILQQSMELVKTQLMAEIPINKQQLQ